LVLGNTSIAGRHVFGGLASGTAPFASFDAPGFDPAAPYSGPAAPFVIRIGSDETLRVTTPGDQVFGDAVATLDDLRQTVAAGNAPVANLDAINTATRARCRRRSRRRARCRRASSTTSAHEADDTTEPVPGRARCWC
jgi:hypothetical protein